MLPVGAMAVVFLPWIGGGERIDAFGLSLSRDGTLRAAAVLLKLAAASLWMSYLLATTPVSRLFGALRTLRVPAILVDILEATVRYLSVLAREASGMLLAARSRSGGPTRSSFLSMRRLGDLIASLFLRTMHRSERCRAAAEARAFGPGDDPDESIKTRTENAIEIEGLSFRYPGGDCDALTAISLAIPPGKRVAVLGANGAGKTSLLLHLNGVHLPQSGNVRVAGIDAKRESLPALRRKVGMVFQDPDDQVIGLTVFEGCRLRLAAAGPRRFGCQGAGRGSSDDCRPSGNAPIGLPFR